MQAMEQQASIAQSKCEWRNGQSLWRQPIEQIRMADVKESFMWYHFDHDLVILSESACVVSNPVIPALGRERQPGAERALRAMEDMAI
jgi:hypothetical protein